MEMSVKVSTLFSRPKNNPVNIDAHKIRQVQHVQKY